MQDVFNETQRKLAGAVAQMMYDFLGNLLKGRRDDPVLRLMIDSMGISDLPPSEIPLDPYRILGLDKSATDEEVKSCYREFLKKLHPDTAGVRGTEFLLQIVNKAYTQISIERGWHR